MKCNQCGTEFEGKFCPECGAKVEAETTVTTPRTQKKEEQTATQPKKKPFFLRWWFILLAIIIIGGISLSGDGGEKIEWDDIVLGQMLPKPPAKKGEIHYNSTEELWVDIIDLSDKQYADYVDACKEKGFIIDAEIKSNSYNAYNEDGYKLELSHYGNDADMHIRLEKPMEMTTIKWPSGTAGKLVPTPKSTKGSFSYEHDDNFFVYVGDTSKADYDEYVIACSDQGFNLDYDKGENYYYADNNEGWHISLHYKGNNIMSIDISAPNKEDVTIDETASYNEESTENMSENNTNIDETTNMSDSPKEESKPDIPEIKPEIDNMNNGGLSPEFKAAMDSYEKFMDEYVAFMKKYIENPSDLGLLADYADYMSKYADFVEDFEKWNDEEMNTAETAYYIDVQTRVNKKLLETN